MVNLAVQQQTGIPAIIGQKEAYNAVYEQSTPAIELYSEPDVIKDDVKASAPAAQTPGTALKSRFDAPVIKEEIRLTPHPDTIVVPEVETEEEVIFPEPSSSRHNR